MSAQDAPLETPRTMEETKKGLGFGKLGKSFKVSPALALANQLHLTFTLSM